MYPHSGTRYPCADSDPQRTQGDKSTGPAPRCHHCHRCLGSTEKREVQRGPDLGDMGIWQEEEGKGGGRQKAQPGVVVVLDTVVI